MVLERRLTGRQELDVVGGHDGQVGLGDRDDATVVAEDDRDRTAPEALAGQQPVPEAVLDGALADPLLLQPLDGLGLGVGHAQAVQPLAVDRRSFACVGLAVEVLGGQHRADDGQVVGLGEVPVPLVLAGHGHDRPGAVGGQHVVGEVDGDLVAGERVHDVGAGEHASLVQRALRAQPLELALAGHMGHEGLDLGPPVVGGQLGHDGVLGRDHGVGHAEAGVGPGGEDLQAQVLLPGDGQVEGGPLGATDPVALHGLDPLGPVQIVDVVQQLLGVVGDLEEPLLQVLALDQVARPLAGAVGQDLLVGQHGLAARAPVHGRLRPVGQAGFQELQEDPLGPAHEGGVVALDHPAPVVGRPQAQQGRGQLLDLGFGERPRMLAGLDGGVLGRQPEAVEADGREDGLAVHRPVADQQVPEGVVAHVAHVGRPARVGVHAQDVGLRAGVVVVDLVGPLVPPTGLPAGLDLRRLVRLALVVHAADRTDGRQPLTGGFGRP